VLGQVCYIVGSILCGLAPTLPFLIFFRLVQGLGAGLTIPLAFALLITHLPKEKWAKTSSVVNLFSLLAPALGPIMAGYLLSISTWRMLFFAKLPISLACLVLTLIWVRKEKRQPMARFDWPGFLFISISVTLLLYVLTRVGKAADDYKTLLLLAAFSFLSLLLFVVRAKKAKNPLIPLSLFRIPMFKVGNLLQVAANMITLGATFVLALYLESALHFSLITTGWLLATVTVGMITGLILVGSLYNRLGPLPFLIPGLIMLSLSMFGFLFVTPTTHYGIIAFLIFMEGFADTIVLGPTVMMMFKEIPDHLKCNATSLFSVCKQLSASLGVALSVLLLTLSMFSHHLDLSSADNIILFRRCFILFGVIPLLALWLCKYIDNKKARFNK